MEKPVFRNPDLFQVLSFRDFIRKYLPAGSEGFIAEDLDLVIRVYGRKFDTDSTGKFMLIELKYGHSWIKNAQIRTFQSIDNILKKGDPERKRYKGYYIIQYSNEDWEKAAFRINRQEVTREGLIRFLEFNLTMTELWE